MELAFVTGYGPALLTDLEQRRPLVRAEDTVVFGFRDADEQRQYGSQPLPTEILALDRAAEDLATFSVCRADLDGGRDPTLGEPWPSIQP